MQPPDAMPAALEGIRVVELCDERGEFLGRLLANLGAEVIKVEPPGGASSRDIGPFYQDQPGAERSIYWWHFNIGKLGVTLDLHQEEGLDLLHRLLHDADVLIESFGPNGLENAGLGGWADLHARYPRLVVASISDFGLDGPWAGYVASDLVALALSGHMMVAGYPPGPEGKYDAPPTAPQMHQSWQLLGCVGMMDVLATLRIRDREGLGQRIDLALHGAANNSTENHPAWYMVAGQVNTRRPQFPELPTKDGNYMQIMPGMFGEEWDRLVALMDKYGMAEDLTDPRYKDPAYRRRPEAAPHIAALIKAFVATQNAEEIFHIAQEGGVVWAPIRAPHENLGDPHMEERGSFIEIEHPEIGRSITYPNAAWVSEELPWRTGPRAPSIGEHNELVYHDRLGVYAEELAALKAKGVI